MMTVDAKREVVEALLCASGEANNVSLYEAALAVGCPLSAVAWAMGESYRVDPVNKKLRVSQRDARQAYRLIESSPTLRCEWFRKP